MRRVKSVTLASLLGVGFLLTTKATASESLLSYDLEDLSQFVVENHTATLTSSSRRETPASVTVISHEQIEVSGARSLDELLEIFVPSFATMYKVHGTQAGIRGIISDRNNKILLLVNGRNMNIKATDGGAATERRCSTLDDVARVTVVSGPGSAVFGPGAIAGVINIETFDGFGLEGTDVRLKGGTGSSFLSAQISHGRKLSPNSALFFYYGIEQASGADDAQAPHKLAFDLPVYHAQTHETVTIEANENFPFPTVPDGASYRAKPRHKAHLQYDSDNLTLWARYTQSGEAVPTLQNFYAFSYYGKKFPDIFFQTGNEHRQWTLYAKYTQNISPVLYIDYSASYMHSSVDITTLNPEIVETGKKWTEKDTLLDAVLHYTPDDRNAFAAGVSFDYTHFTNKRKLFTTLSPHIPDDEHPLSDHPEWYGRMWSFYGEYQGKFSETTTFFAGLRLDRHRFSPWMISPRLALIHMPTARDTFKLLYNHSVRHSDDADLFSIYLTTGEDGDVEKIDHLEGIYVRDFREGGRFELSIFYNRHEVVAFNQQSVQQEYIGTLRFFGVEARYDYKKENLSFFLSHSYTKELDFDLADPSLTYQNISASAYGYGNDLANWHDHITKMEVEWRKSPDLLLTGSLRIYWGMPGAKDMADYNMEFLDPPTLLLPLYDDGTRAFEESLFLDLGVRYRLDRRTEAALYGYDLLGLIDEDLNKRNFFQRTSHYRDTAPSVAVELKYRF